MFDRPLGCLAASDQVALPLHSVRPDGLEAGLARLDPAHAAFLRAGGFTGKAGQLRLLPGEDGLSGAVLGLGEDRSPYAHGALPFGLPEGTAWSLEPGDFDMGSAVLGFCLGAYRFEALRRPERGPALLAGADGDAAALATAQATAQATTLATALATARATWLARDLINAPANVLGPAELAGATRDLAARFGVTAVLTEGEPLARDYPALAAVGAGSDRAPVVAQFAWQGSGVGPGSPLVSLCGKGVCFDSGGYDLKPSSAMLRMKKDMGGAALMLALAALVMDSDLPVRLEVRIGCVENMVSGRAMRPMDVLQTRRGHSVEVGNTDAEGRLVLCDLLAEACDAGPDLLIDAATLTGAARVALGPDLPALFCNDDALAAQVMEAGLREHDAVWRLPLWAGYDAWLSSKTADFSTVGSRPMAGAVIAALFLQRFVTPGIRWVHLDTYAWNDSGRPGRPEGGEALGVRALFATIRELKQVNIGG